MGQRKYSMNNINYKLQCKRCLVKITFIRALSYRKTFLMKLVLILPFSLTANKIKFTKNHFNFHFPFCYLLYNQVSGLGSLISKTLHHIFFRTWKWQHPSHVRGLVDTEVSSQKTYNTLISLDISSIFLFEISLDIYLEL